MIALPWLVLSLTGNALAVGSVLVTAGIPRALFMLVGGALTDRFTPHRLMINSNLVRLALTGLLAALVGTNLITWLQQKVAPEMTGRVMSFVMFAAIGLNPVSTALAGALIGLNTTVLLICAGMLMTLFTLSAAFSPIVRAGME